MDENVPELSIIKEKMEYRGYDSEGGIIRIAYKYIKGETVDDLVKRLSLDGVDHLEIRLMMG